MTIIHTLILAIVEGITEFLPVSSTGHLILVSKLLRIPDTEFTKSFDIFIQLGAIMAVVTLYAKKVYTKPALIPAILVGFLPTGILGLIFYKTVKTHLLGNDGVVVGALIIVGIILIILEMIWKSQKTPVKTQSMDALPMWRYGVIGLFQAVSMIPGVSRSAASIVGGMTMGMNRKDAVEFSFLLAVPTMAAAVGLDLVKNARSFSNSEFVLLSVGFAVSWITALIVVKAFVRFVAHATFTPFGIYRIAAAILYWGMMRV